MPKAVSPSRCRMKGDRKTPTRILTPRLNQLEPTFLKISARRIVSGPARQRRDRESHRRPGAAAGRGWAWAGSAHTFSDGDGDLVSEKVHQVAPRRFDLLRTRGRQGRLPSPGLGHTHEGNVPAPVLGGHPLRSEEHTSELQSRFD